MVVKNLSPQMPNGGVFDVKAYGAVGNGSTDDATAIGNCLAAAGTYAASNGGATVVFPPGKYKWNSVKEVKSDTTIYAYGAHFIGNSTAGFLKNYASTPAAGYTTGNQRITVLGGIWDGVGQSASSGVKYNLFDFRNARGFNVRDAVFRNVSGLAAILLTAVENASVQTCRFEGHVDNDASENGMKDAVRMAMDGSNNTCNGISMTNCYVGAAIDGSGLGSFGTGIGSHEDASTKYYTGIRVTGNFFDDTVNCGVRGFSWASAVISDNNFNSPGWEAIEMQIANNTSTSRIIITGNTINDPAFPGIFFNDGGFNQVTISGNVIQNPTSGMQLEGINTGTVTGNTIWGASSIGIKITTSDYVTISNNSIMSPENDGIELTTCTGCMVSGNMIWDAGLNGIQLLSGSSYNSIMGNMVIGCSRAHDAWYFPINTDNNAGNDFNAYMGNRLVMEGGSQTTNLASHGMRIDGGATEGNVVVFNSFDGWGTAHADNILVNGGGTPPQYNTTTTTTNSYE